MNKRPSICFVAPKAYPALLGGVDTRDFGGAEVQQALLARGLADRGYRVALVANDYGQPAEEAVGSVEVYRITARGSAWRRRIRLPGPLPLWHAMRRANSDLYFQKTAGAETGYTAMYCRANKRTFLHIVSSERGCHRTLACCPKRIDRLLYRLGIQLADGVLAQTEAQSGMLLDEFKLRSVRLPSCSEDPYEGHDALPDLAHHRRPRVLWAGRFDPVKRLDMLLEIAAKLPHVDFDVAGWSRPCAYLESLVAAAARLPNIFLHRAVPRPQMHELYVNASLLLCTSQSEGYPNTFMEAWARGVPTVSTVDPDGVIQQHGLGRVAATVEGLVGAIEPILRDASLWAGYRQRARRFFLNHHSIAATLDRLEQIIAALCPGGRTGGLPTSAESRGSYFDSTAPKSGAGPKLGICTSVSTAPRSITGLSVRSPNF